ncbi:hypothetical protein C6P40_003913 [Pichia californica]|uniref:Dipeptidase n=1 Tax=Pichia californica TaxID=460514 RepID=A0A9P6WIQ6_9ASCO|nr:hypothetical protein C6P42_003941 [[Candida] californica]KAG0686513.1 hypothetical protein C6P40_003913 [[Candida] californica]
MLDEEYMQKFRVLNKKIPVVDTHNDLPYSIRSQLHYELHSEHTEFDFDKELTCHTDLGRMREGGLGIQFFSCYIEGKGPDELYTDFNAPNSIVRDTLEQIDIVRRLVDEYSHKMHFVRTADEALANYIDSKNDKISITLGVEGLHQVDLSLAVVRQYFDLGVRYITLTHNCDNPFATAASSVILGKEDKGLTDYGIDCIKEMNRLGMMVDLSHVSYKTMVDVLEVTQAPVIFSHSSAYALTHHERNVRDDVLKMVKENYGVVCVNFCPSFISKKGEEEATIDDAVNHVKHIVDVIGWDHVGIGSDFEGIPEGPKGLEDVSKYPDLITKLWKLTNATEDDISKFMGLNVLRVWKKCEEVSKNLSSKMLPIETNWAKRIWEFPDYITEEKEIYPGSLKLHEKNNVLTSSSKLTLKSNYGDEEIDAEEIDAEEN